MVSNVFVLCDLIVKNCTTVVPCTTYLIAKTEDAAFCTFFILVKMFSYYFHDKGCNQRVQHLEYFPRGSNKNHTQKNLVLNDEYSTMR